MFTIVETEGFSRWLSGLRDMPTRMRLLTRLRKASLGNLGDVKPVGGGVWEMREFFGPGWRMYYVQRGEVLLVMLGGGVKSSQQKDIATAQALAKEINL
jgi:putative addiction module killer protein